MLREKRDNGRSRNVVELNAQHLESLSEWVGEPVVKGCFEAVVNVSGAVARRMPVAGTFIQRVWPTFGAPIDYDTH